MYTLVVEKSECKWVGDTWQGKREENEHTGNEALVFEKEVGKEGSLKTKWEDEI